MLKVLDRGFCDSVTRAFNVTPAFLGQGLSLHHNIAVSVSMYLCLCAFICNCVSTLGMAKE